MGHLRGSDDESPRVPHYFGASLAAAFVIVVVGFVLLLEEGVPLLHPHREDGIFDRELCEQYCEAADAVLVELEADDLRGPVCHCAFPDYE